MHIHLFFFFFIKKKKKKVKKKSEFKQFTKKQPTSVLYIFSLSFFNFIVKINK
jgi:hypothetical protein